MAEQSLENQTLENTPLFSLDGTVVPAKVVKVYDGDTVHIVFSLFGKFVRFVCRIAHIDAPELRSKNENEKAKAQEVKAMLTSMLLDKIMTVTCQKFDKFGRLLIEVDLPEGEKLHKWMIANKHVNPYEGGTKQKWD